MAIVDGDNKVQLLLAGIHRQAGGGGGITIFSGSGKPELVLRALPHGGLVELGSAKGAQIAGSSLAEWNRLGGLSKPAILAEHVCGCWPSPPIPRPSELRAAADSAGR